jgi:chitin disaccharide deacetylase
MTHLNPGQTNRLLGYPPDARLLILNADDFGMCHAINAAIIGALRAGLVHSTSLMAPCPWALEASGFLKEHPEIPCGVHLTAISDAHGYAWGPLTSRERVPSLVDPRGYFFDAQRFPGQLGPPELLQLEVEFRTQIETVLAAGLQPAHLDWHTLHVDERPELYTLLLRLAKAYGLALRMTGQSWIESVQGQGLPANDHDLLDSWTVDPLDKPARYAHMLHELPAGLSEWAVHPGLDDAELLALEPDGNHVRQTDFDFWTSQPAKDLVEAEGIILIDYRAIQAVWKAS